MPYAFGVILVTLSRYFFQHPFQQRPREGRARRRSLDFRWHRLFGMEPLPVSFAPGAIPDRIPTAKRVLISTGFRIPTQTQP